MNVSSVTTTLSLLSFPFDLEKQPVAYQQSNFELRKSFSLFSSEQKVCTLLSLLKELQLKNGWSYSRMPAENWCEALFEIGHGMSREEVCVLQIKTVLKEDPTLLKKRSLMQACLAIKGRLLKHMGEENQKDFSLILTAVKSNREAVRFAHIKNCTAEEAIELVEHAENCILFINEQLINEGFFIQALKRNSRVFVYLFIDEERFRRCRTMRVLCSAMRCQGLFLRHIPEIRKSWFAINCSDLDRLAAYAIRQNGLALQYCNAKQKNNLRFVLPAVRQNPLAIQHARKAQRNNVEVAYFALYSVHGWEVDQERRNKRELITEWLGRGAREGCNARQHWKSGIRAEEMASILEKAAHYDLEFKMSEALIQHNVSFSSKVVKTIGSYLRC